MQTRTACCSGRQVLARRALVRHFYQQLLAASGKACSTSVTSNENSSVPSNVSDSTGKFEVDTVGRIGEATGILRDTRMLCEIFFLVIGFLAPPCGHASTILFVMGVI